MHNEPLPRKSGMTEYHDYAKTLEIYEKVFGNKPPAHIWPEPEERFNFTMIYSRKFININSYMVSVQQNKKNPGLMASSTLKQTDNMIMLR